jgi:hypothetical protein
MTDEEIERALARSRRQEELQAKVAQLIEEVNGGSSRELADAIVGALQRSHRTLQQEFMGAVKLAIAGYATADHDLRNEAAVGWAKRVAAMENADLRFPHL